MELSGASTKPEAIPAVKMLCVDTDSDDAEYVLTRKSTRKSNVGKFYARVEGMMIFRVVKNMMIDFGEDAGQCVLGTDSRSAESIMEQCGAGRIQERVEYV